jgi:glycopeptide antibiotics resistance protein
MSHPTPPRFPASGTALAASVAFILVLTLTPTHAHHEVHLRPLEDVLAAFDPTLDVVRLLGVIGNVVLFAPLGAVLRVRGVGLRRTAVLGLVLSTAIELTQLGVPGRTTSVDDVLLNTLGIVAGSLLAARSLSGSGRL